MHVSEFVFALNSADHEFTGVAPSRLMLGRAMRSPPSNRLDSTILDPPLYYQSRRQPTIRTGDHVMVKSHPLSNASKPFSAKLADRWSSPYVVVDLPTPVNLKLVSLAQPNKEIIAHVDQVKLCQIE